MSAMAENKLKSMSYVGEKCCWNFEKFVQIHKDQHSILEGLVEGDEVIVSDMSTWDEHDRVRLR